MHKIGHPRSTAFAFLSLALATASSQEPAVPKASPTATVLARYNFDGRAPKGTRVQRPRFGIHPYSGEEYDPNPLAGECGPALQNPGPGGDAPSAYRSYYNHAAAEATTGRETLELDGRHPWLLDTYRTRPGAAALPIQGSFTWELVVRIDAFDGTDHQAILLDNSIGAGRIPNYPGEGANRAVVNRLWLGPIADGRFPLRLTVPVDDRNRGATLETPLALGTWYHLAAVYDEAEHASRLYVDGKLAAEASVTSWNQRATGFGIGTYGPDVFRIDHAMNLQKAYFDAVAISAAALRPGAFVLAGPERKAGP